MREFTIWSEGFKTARNSAQATCHGKATGHDFKDACNNFFRNNPLYNSVQLTHWGCGLFDNEQDARRSFG